MGLLSQLGETFTYEEAVQFFEEIKQKGLIQFLKLYAKFHEKKLQNPPVLWGDEIEFHVLNFDPERKEVKLQCNIDYIYKKFAEINKEQTQEFQIQPEYGAWMLETVPTLPFKYCCDFEPVLKNMTIRRKVIVSLLENNDMLFSIPVFPLMGTPNSFLKPQGSQMTTPSLSPKLIDQPPNPQLDIKLQSAGADPLNEANHNEEQKADDKSKKNTNYASQSIFVSDEIINSHPRFPALTKNIRDRRGEKVNIRIPLFIDEKTNTEATEEEPYPGFIYMDAMAFGMGNCCLQVTFSTKDIDSARFFYDQLGIMAPLILPFTAGSPIFKGKLANTDARWDSIVASVDDRTEDERNPYHPLYIPKSRYDTISYFISNSPKFRQEYNDVKFPVNLESIDFLKEKQKEFNVELDENLLKHLGFLYIRDPLVIFKNPAQNPSSTADFENIQSTNWNSVRFKPPPNLDSTVNWRTEFRPMEVQITDEENALYSFLVLRILRMLSFEEFKLNFYIPMSLVDENFKRAVKKNALLEQKFFVRINVFDEGKPEIKEMTLHEYFFGTKDFVGMESIVSQFHIYFNTKYGGNIPQQFFVKCQKQNDYLFKYLKEKTSGAKLTLASWIRKFVLTHPAYKKDSIVSNEIAYDLLKKISDISNGVSYDQNFDCGLIV